MADDDKLFAMLCHLLAIFTWFIGPLVVWLVKRGESDLVDQNGKNVLNFIILVSIVSVIVFILATVLGIILPVLAVLFGLVSLAISIAALVFYIMGSIKSYGGEVYQYPVTFAFIK